MIYFVQDSGTLSIKIGSSLDPDGRVSKLQTGNQSRLVLLAAVQGDGRDERRLHQRFASARVSGEWFRPVPELLQHISQQAAAHERMLQEVFDCPNGVTQELCDTANRDKRVILRVGCGLPTCAYCRRVVAFEMHAASKDLRQLGLDLARFPPERVRWFVTYNLGGATAEQRALLEQEFANLK